MKNFYIKPETKFDEAIPSMDLLIAAESGEAEPLDSKKRDQEEEYSWDVFGE